MATAARIERVLNGLRPRVEVEGAPIRWSLAERMAAYRVPAVSIAIIDGGRVVWAQGFGVTEVGGPRPGHGPRRSSRRPSNSKTDHGIGPCSVWWTGETLSPRYET